MKQDIVLPKFKIPGQTNWIVRGLWIAGGLVAVQVVAMGFFLWSRNGKIEEEARAAAARQQAMLAAQQAAAAVPAPVPPPASGGAKAQARHENPAIPASTTMVAAPRSRATASAGPSGRATLTKGRYKRGKGAVWRKKGGGSSRGKMLARTGAGRSRATPARPAKGPAPKRDAIDDILRKFK